MNVLPSLKTALKSQLNNSAPFKTNGSDLCLLKLSR